MASYYTCTKRNVTYFERERSCDVALTNRKPKESLDPVTVSVHDEVDLLSTESINEELSGFKSDSDSECSSLESNET